MSKTITRPEKTDPKEWPVLICEINNLMTQSFTTMQTHKEIATKVSKLASIMEDRLTGASLDKRQWPANLRLVAAKRFACAGERERADSESLLSMQLLNGGPQLSRLRKDETSESQSPDGIRLETMISDISGSKIFPELTDSLKFIVRTYH